ncbi:MAG: SNF2-related protein [Armatimonadota bacterium]
MCYLEDFYCSTPVSQYGLVKSWKARSVRFDHLLYTAMNVDPQTSSTTEHTPDPAASANPYPERNDVSNKLKDALARLLFAILQPPAATLLSACGPLEWPSDFFPFQREGIQALLQSRHLLLGDDMGLGKTVQAIAALRVLLTRHEIERALVVAPASLLDQWRRELALWAPELRVMVVRGNADNRSWQWPYRAHVTITSYETLRADCSGMATCPTCREPWGVVILDEAQKIKNRDSAQSHVCKRQPRERSWALTGTPLENRVDDVRSILEFVTGPDGNVSLHRPLRETLGEFQLRRRKADVLLDLPPKISTELELSLTSAQRRSYDRAEREGIVRLRELGDIRIEHVLALISHLKQICNFDPEGGASAKMDDLIAHLRELSAEGHKALVFTQYTNDTSGARSIVDKLQQFHPVLYTGDMDATQREAAIERFKTVDDARVLVLSLKVGGQGLNLQCASYVFHFDRWWNPAVELQAEDRAHRIGQTQPVHVYTYIMADTIEQRIDEILKSKRALFTELVDMTSLDIGQFLTKQEIFGLVGLAPPGKPTEALPGAGLEERVARLMAHLGYRVEKTPRSRDGGVDVIAEREDAVGTRHCLLIQCKDNDRLCGVEAVRSLNGVLPDGQRGTVGVVVCPSGFSTEARSFAIARNIHLWDEDKLDAMEHQQPH